MQVRVEDMGVGPADPYVPAGKPQGRAVFARFSTDLSHDQKMPRVHPAACLTFDSALSYFAISSSLYCIRRCFAADGGVAHISAPILHLIVWNHNNHWNGVRVQQVTGYKCEDSQNKKML
eukprot:2160233-Amphidinium_carterae.1